MAHYRILFFFLCVSLFACKANNVSASLKNITVSEIAKLKVDHTDLVILDVRTPEEISKGKIDSAAKEIDFYSDDFKNRILALDKNATYLVYCKSGGRSSKAASILVNNGYKDVYNLEGGYTKWLSSN